MDRLQKDEVLVLFRTMRLIADFPNVIYLVGYDPDYIETILEEKSDENKSRFMEKIFQLEFDLPDPLPSDLINFWEEVITDIIPKDKSGLQKRIINNIVINKVIPNLRDIKRFLNQLSINHSLPEIKSNTYLPQFFLLELIFYCDPIMYYKIRESKSFDYDENTKPETKKVIDQIKGLDHNSKQSIIKKEHFEKYFFKRLDKKKEIDYKDIETIFEEEKFEKELENLYYTNKIQLADHILHFISSKIKIKDSIDKTLALDYLNRIIYLFDFSYTREGLQKNHFENEINFSGKPLVEGIINTFEIFSNNNPKSIKEFKNYFSERVQLNCIPYLLANITKESTIDPILHSFNSLYKTRISITIKNHPIDFTPLLIDLFNYQKFKNNLEADEYVITDILLDPDIIYPIRNNIKYIYSDFNRIKKTNKELGILSFFGSKDNLLALNNMNNKDVSDVFDIELREYPIRKKVNSFELVHRFNYDKYNSKINVPKSIKKVVIKSLNGNILYQLDFSDATIKTIKKPDFINPKEPIDLDLSANEYLLTFYRLNSGCHFLISESSESPVYSETINGYPDYECEILISTINSENFIVYNSLRDSKVQEKIESKLQKYEMLT